MQRLGSGICYETFEDLAATLRDPAKMQAMRERAWSSREAFMFDTHAPALVDFFRQAMEARRSRPAAVDTP